MLKSRELDPEGGVEMIVLYEKKDKIATITLNRPEVMNAINRELAGELHGAWYDFAGDPALSVLVVTGAGEKAFCVGADLKEKEEKGDVHVTSFWEGSTGNATVPARRSPAIFPVER